MDDFQFKPITEGLGFHKKPLHLKEEMADMPLQTGILPKAKSPLSNPFKSSVVPNITRPLASQPVTARPSPSPIPQTRSNASAAPMAPAAAWGAALPNKDFVEQQNMPVRLVEISANWPASLFDTAMVAGLTLLFSAIVFALTRVDLELLLESLKTDFGVQTSTVAVIFAVLEMYTVSTRTFFGKTLGEWVFDARLGDLKEQSTFLYPFKVAWRTFVIALTGFIVLPALSSLVGEDIAGILSGVKLFAEKR